MQSAAKDIADILNGESSLGLTLGTDLFYSRMPDENNGEADVVAVYDSPGAGPMLAQTKGYSVYNYAAVNIRVRNTDYDTGYDLMRDIMVYLHGYSGTINSAQYGLIRARDDVAPLPPDENDRFIFVVNFEVQRVDVS